MNARFDDAVWSGVVNRLSDVERYIPAAPAWRASIDSQATRGSISLGRAFGRTRPPRSQRAQLIRILVVAAALLALVGVAILVASRPDADLRTGPLGPLGILRGSDSHSHTALLPDGRVLIVSGTWIGMGAAGGRADIWSPDGGLESLEPPQTARVSPTITLLLDGRVLVVGGYGGQYQYPSSATASAEIWDPKTEAFTPTGSMSIARVGHTATLLADGRVLVVGGQGPAGIERTAELWDPGTGTFSPAGTLINGRAGHASVLQPNGNVLVAGGHEGAGSGVGLLETWSPMTGAFTGGTYYLDDPRAVSATRLLDGGVLLAGVFALPYTSGGGLKGVDVLGSTLDRPPYGLSRPRDGHSATLLPNGDVLIAGGWAIEGTEALASVERFDLTTGTFREVAPLQIAAAGHDAILLPDGRILIVPDATGLKGFVPPFIYHPDAPSSTP